MQVCTSLQTDNHASTPPLKFFTGRMPFVPPNQKRQSTEGTAHQCYQNSWLKTGRFKQSHLVCLVQMTQLDRIQHLLAAAQLSWFYTVKSSHSQQHHRPVHQLLITLSPSLCNWYNDDKVLIHTQPDSCQMEILLIKCVTTTAHNKIDGDWWMCRFLFPFMDNCIGQKLKWDNIPSIGSSVNTEGDVMQKSWGPMSNSPAKCQKWHPAT